jgi:F0F1-type ATP synthase membrane subunit c/vacuolar-type H+-ATPase subunit K
MSANGEKIGRHEVLRVGLAVLLGGFIAALALAVLLIALANVDAHQPATTDLSVDRILGSSFLFCFFTLPIAVILGVPLYLVLRRFNLLRVSVCSALGAIVGMLTPYSFRLVGAAVELSPVALVWFALSGAAAGAVMGALVRRPRSAPTPGNSVAKG